MKLEGSKVHNYLIKEVIGKGGMGIVYLAQDTILQKDVCVKFLNKNYKDDEELKKRFQREIIIMAQLQGHDHIVNIYGGSEYNGYSYFVMEYVDGVSVDKLISNEHPVTWWTSLKIGKSVLDAINFTKKHQIIHRDIKPSNIIINKNGIVKITDFGLSKSIIGSFESTDPGIIMGTPCYMAPEQWLGNAVLEYSDIYSLGILMYELIMSEPPFKTPTGYTDITASLKYKEKYIEKLKQKNIPLDVSEFIVNLFSLDTRERKTSFINMNQIDFLLKKYNKYEENHIINIKSKIDGSKNVSQIDTYIPDEISTKLDSRILKEVFTINKISFVKMMVYIFSLFITILIAYITMEISLK